MASSSRILTAPDVVDVPACARLRVQLVRGAVEVVAADGDRDGVGIELTEIAGAPIEVAGDGDEVSIGYPSIGWDGWLKRLATSDATDRVRLVVRVGASTRVRVAAVGAAVTLGGLAEDAEVVTASGDVTVTGSTAGVEIRTASGAVVVRALGGPASVVTVSGDALVEGALSRASVTTVAGAVTLEHTGGAAVLTTTTVSGATSVRVPVGAEVDLEVRGVTGAVTLDGSDVRSGAVTRHRGPGTGPAVTVRATTVSGGVDVVHATPAPPIST